MKFNQMIKENPMKQKLLNGEVVIGTWINNLHSPAIAKMLGAAGFDFVSLDMQHGASNLETIANECLVARLSGVVPLVRPNDPNDLRMNGRLLDIGACGLIVPDVDSKEMAEKIVKSAKYFNGGTRGIVSISYNTGFTPSVKEDFVRSDENTVIVIQIENKKGVDNIDEILSVSGIDVVVVGRGDMAHDIGATGNMNDPQVNEMVDKVFAAAKRYNVIAGLMCPTAEKGVERVKAGAKFINYSNEQAILMKAYKEFLKEVRAAG